MPLHRSCLLSGGCRGWAVWKVDETAEELRHILPDEGVYVHELSAFQATAKRCLERLAVRVLMYTCWGTEHPVSYTSAGKPYLVDHTYYISISHTKGYVAIVWSDEAPSVGIDIEQMQPKAYRLRTRFMHAEEWAEGDEIQAALLHWSAKETLYKMLSRQADTDFVEHLCVSPFKIQDTGSIQVYDRRDPVVTYSLSYFVHPDYVLTVLC